MTVEGRYTPLTADERDRLLPVQYTEAWWCGEDVCTRQQGQAMIVERDVHDAWHSIQPEKK